MKVYRLKQVSVLAFLGAFFAMTPLLTHAGVEFVASGSNSITGHTSLADARFSLNGTVLTVDIYNTSTNASTDPTEVLTGILFNNAPSSGPIVSTSSEYILAGGKVFPGATSVISYATKTPLSSIACLVANANGGLWDYRSSSQNPAIPAPFNGGFACVNYGFKNNGKDGLVSSNFVGNLNNIKYTVMAPPLELVVSNYTGTLPTALAFCYGTSTNDPILTGVNISQAPVRIGDYVWVDANGNGLQDSGETGLSGVSVVLYRTNSGLGTLTALATNTTSATGAYLFTNQLPNSFVVGFGAASGYTRTSPYQGSNSNLDSNAQVGSGLSEVFSLTSGQTNLTVDAGYYQAANLSGTVVLDVNGNAVQDAVDTNGLSGVVITLKTNGVAMLTATTGSTGAYSFTNLPPGSYTVVQTVPAGYTNTTALSLSVTLVSGQSSPGNKFLDTKPVTIGDYAWVDANGNGIQDNGETGLAGVSVILYRTNSGLGTLTTVATTTTSVSGAYLFTNQLPNSFVVGFGAVSGYTRTAAYQGSNTNLDSNAQLGSGLSEVFTLTSGQTNVTVDAGYFQLGNLSGTMVLDVNANGLQDAGETNVLSGVLITLKTNGVTMLTTTTGSAGAYSFTNLAPGSYTVVQTVPAGYTNTTALSLPVTLVSGQSSPGHNYLDTQPVTIGHYVWVDADGDGIQDNGELG
ncbi:MAG: XDD4 family exosortase-dependent surface protein, partial [Verrucomicrobiota bacterium]